MVLSRSLIRCPEITMSEKDLPAARALTIDLHSPASRRGFIRGRARPQIHGPAGAIRCRA